MTVIDTYITSCRELTRFCSQNGWIDNASLRYGIEWESDHVVLVTIEFDELLGESSERITERVACAGQLRLYLDNDGQVERTEIL